MWLLTAIYAGNCGQGNVVINFKPGLFMWKRGMNKGLN